MSLALCNPRQREFIDEYIRNGFNGTQAYLHAYKNSTYENARVSSSETLAKPYIQAALEERKRELGKLSGVGIDKRIKWLEEAIEGALERHTDQYGNSKVYAPNAAISAVTELNRMTGAHAPTKIAETDSDGFDKPTGITVTVVKPQHSD